MEKFNEVEDEIIKKFLQTFCINGINSTKKIINLDKDKGNDIDNNDNNYNKDNKDNKYNIDNKDNDKDNGKDKDNDKVINEDNNIFIFNNSPGKK